MFTGIIQEVGKVKALSHQGTNLIIEVEARKISSRLNIGDSVAINGACQTVVAYNQNSFKVEAVAETLSRTNLGTFKPGSPVNLENPLSLNDLMHGHMVQGHVDCAGHLTAIKPLDGSILFTIDYPQEYGKYLIEKGSVAVDGISLTVVKTESTSFQISMIPHTFENTIFRYRRAGDSVNLEFDMIAKYIYKMISPLKRESKITIDYLKEHGF